MGEKLLLFVYRTEERTYRCAFLKERSLILIRTQILRMESQVVNISRRRYLLWQRRWDHYQDLTSFVSIQKISSFLRVSQKKSLTLQEEITIKLQRLMGMLSLV